MLFSQKVAPFLAPAGFIAVVTSTSDTDSCGVRLFDATTLELIESSDALVHDCSSFDYCGHLQGCDGRVFLSTFHGRPCSIEAYGVQPWTLLTDLKLDDVSVDAMAIAPSAQRLVLGIDERLHLWEGLRAREPQLVEVRMSQTMGGVGKIAGIKFLSGESRVLVAGCRPDLWWQQGMFDSFNVMGLTTMVVLCGLDFSSHEFPIAMPFGQFEVFENEHGQDAAVCLCRDRLVRLLHTSILEVRLLHTSALETISARHMATGSLDFRGCNISAMAHTGLVVASWTRVHLLDRTSLAPTCEVELPLLKSLFRGNAPHRHRIHLACVHSTGTILIAQVEEYSDGVRSEQVHLLDGRNLAILQKVQQCAGICDVATIPWSFARRPGHVTGKAKAGHVCGGTGAGARKAVASGVGSKNSAQDAGSSLPFEDISHGEPAAEIDAEEARHVNEELWASSRCVPLNMHMPGGDTHGSGLHAILLHFDRMTRELKEALLSSRPARSLLVQGINIQPAWAGGAIILVHVDAPFLEGSLKLFHVLVDQADEQDLIQALGDLPIRYKKLKTRAGRKEVLNKLSLLDISSEGEHEVSNDAASVIPYRVKSTFIDIRPAPESRSVCTW